MDATPFDPSPLAPDFFDIYNDANAPARGTPSLPNGGCNFVDVTPGSNGARCGCRRFWARQVPGSPVPDQSGWCMCHHHACYHDEGSHDVRTPVANTAGQENERPRTGREPLSPMLGMPVKTPPAVPGMDFSSFGGAAPLSCIHDVPDEDALRSKVTPSQQFPGSLPDTLAWGDFISGDPSNARTLPPIPPQCLMPSQTASVTSSVQAKYSRPFAGKGLQTLGGASGSKSRVSPQQRPEEQGIAQPDTGALSGSFVLVDKDGQGAAAPPPAMAAQSGPQSSAVVPEAVRDLMNTVSDHGQRLDRLETTSFQAECHDRNDNMEVRMYELESRVEDVEGKLVNDNASDANTRRGRDEDTASLSVVSASTRTTTQSQDLMSRIQSLQAQVTQLQSYLPSPSHAWEVEVVFLPFPLKRLWQEIHQFKADAATAGSDEWTQLHMTHSTSTMRSESPFNIDWATAEHDAEWLLPRACGNTGIMDKRLRSRGLVQKVSVKAPDYRSVQIAMHDAFGGVFRDMKMISRPLSSDHRLATFFGLQQHWVPLRKVHKDSRLRFLSPAEMVNPTLWDVPFLTSVMMRSSEPRLFITHPDAYLQDLQAYECGWTWQRVREMTRVHPDLTESQEVPEADALEEYWSWSEQLDEAPSAHTSMSMRHERQRVSMSPLLVQCHTGQSWRRSMSPAVARGQSPLLLRRDSLPPHIRTTSVPVVAPARPSPALDRRRVVSYEQNRRSSPGPRLTAQAGVLKRRRTRSPSHRRFTPRWTASPSPMPLCFNEHPAPRGTTPFAYATPYSNAPQPVRGSSVARTVTNYAAEPDYELPDIDIYESGTDEEGSFTDADHRDDNGEGDESSSGGEVVTHAQPNPLHDSLQWPLPEDEPWPGIEDQDHLSDGENIDPQRQDDPHDDRSSEASSQPSEYPSTNNAWPADGVSAFHIHEDGA